MTYSNLRRLSQPRTLLSAWIVVFAWIGICGLGSSCVSAQDSDDPFGDASAMGDTLSAEPSDDQPEASRPNTRRGNVADTALPPSDHPIVNELDANPPKTGPELARAALYMSRLRQWERLKRYLDQMNAMKIDGRLASQMIDEIGMDRWLSIRSSASGHLSDADFQILSTLIDQSSTMVRSQAALDGYITALKSKDIVEVRKGIRGLQSAGAIGLTHLLNAASDLDAAPTRGMQEALRSFGEQGVDAWSAALVSDKAKAREQLVRLASTIEPRRLLKDLTTVVYSSIDTPEAKKFVSEWLSKEFGQVPSDISVAQFLSKELDSCLKSIESIRTIDVPLTKEVWRRTNEGLLISEFVPESMYEIERAYRIARNLAMVGAAKEEMSPLALASLLEHAYLREPSVIVEDPMGASAAVVGDSMRDDAAQLAKAWEAAQAYQMMGAQLRLVQMMGTCLATSAENRAELLSKLAEATKNGHPAVRYASVQALQDLLNEPLPGGNRGMETMIEMLGLEGRPLMLLISNDSSLRDHVSQLLGQIGYRSEHCFSGREAIRWLDQPNPVEGILVLDQVSDMTMSQLMQRIRLHHRGSKVPIGILAERIEASQFLVLKEMSGIARSFVPPNVDGLVEMMKDLDQFAPGLGMSSTDRAIWRSIAQDIVRGIYEKPVDQRAAALANWQTWIDRRMTGSVYAESAAGKLIQLGTRDSQLELARRAIDQQLASRDRREAAESLVESFRRSQVKLSINEMQELYDAYNAQGRSDLEARKYLGGILDTIEATGAHRP